MDFKLLHTNPYSSARAGIIKTDHGEIETPIFMPVGTVASVKGVHIKEVKEDIQAQIILGNTYHLYLRPGLDILEKAGGLHKFNGWDRPILTDSGGFQVFSLADNRKLTEEGAIFRSHIDGSKHFFTPENVVDIQRTIGADIMMAFDECTPGTADYKYAKNSMERTHRWLKRGLERFDSTPDKYGYSQTFFPIVQGCVYPELRRESAKFIADQGREGNAIGGLAVGETAVILLTDEEIPAQNKKEFGTEFVILNDFNFSRQTELVFSENGFENIEHSENAVPVTPGDWEDFVGKAYSGSCVYETIFTLPDEKVGKAGKLDLGDVHYAASVYINDKFIGTVLTTPYCIEIPEDILSKNNTLRIVVTNTSANRYVNTDYFNKWKTEELSPYFEPELEYAKDFVSGGLYGQIVLYTE